MSEEFKHAEALLRKAQRLTKSPAILVLLDEAAESIRAASREVQEGEREAFKRHLDHLYDAVWKACGDNEERVRGTIESQGGDLDAIRAALASRGAEGV